MNLPNKLESLSISISYYIIHYLVIVFVLFCLFSFNSFLHIINSQSDLVSHSDFDIAHMCISLDGPAIVFSLVLTTSTHLQTEYSLDIEISLQMDGVPYSLIHFQTELKQMLMMLMLILWLRWLMADFVIVFDMLSSLPLVLIKLIGYPLPVG